MHQKNVSKKGYIFPQFEPLINLNSNLKILILSISWRPNMLQTKYVVDQIVVDPNMSQTQNGILNNFTTYKW